MYTAMHSFGQLVSSVLRAIDGQKGEPGPGVVDAVDAELGDGRVADVDYVPPARLFFEGGAVVLGEVLEELHEEATVGHHQDERGS